MRDDISPLPQYALMAWCLFKAQGQLYFYIYLHQPIQANVTPVTWRNTTATFLYDAVGECIQKFPDWVDNEIYAYNDKLSLRSNIKGYDGQTHLIDSQNSDTTAPSGRELYHLQFSLHAASPETFGYTLVYYYPMLQNLCTYHKSSCT
jgi:hypothetical protein